MKKLFKYEINESVAAKAAMNCVHKRLFKELYAFGTPVPQEEVARGDYDPYEWEYDDYGNEDKRHLVLQALVQAGLIQSEEEGLSLNNKIQQLLDKTNFSVSNEQDAMKFVKAYGQQIVGETQEQEEMEVTDAKHALTQLAAELLRYPDGDLDELYYVISDIINSEEYCPEPEEYDDWIEEHVDEIHDLMVGGTISENEEENHSNDNHGIKMIMDIMIANRLMSNDPSSRQIAWKLIQRKLNEEGMWIGDDNHKAEEFVSFFGEDLEEEIEYWRW